MSIFQFEIWFSENHNNYLLLRSFGRLLEIEYPLETLRESDDSPMTQKILLPKGAYKFIKLDPDMHYIGDL